MKRMIDNHEFTHIKELNAISSELDPASNFDVKKE